jgi:acetyltransferase-like isoleucine patch superfamily enzyme
VKINAYVYICTGVTIERGVMVSAGVVFTNDRFPRATTSDLRALRPSEPDEQTLPTLVREGATIGAQATIGCGLIIGRFAMIGMGSVLTHDVPDFVLVAGNPARPIGYVCACGQPLLPRVGRLIDSQMEKSCSHCLLRYTIDGPNVKQLATVS